jgi:phage regulator Rha-like protein
MFQLTFDEANASRSQSVALKRGRNVKYAPYAFTEQGVAMLSSVLRSRRAVQMNIAIMRAFVKLRDTLALHAELAAKLTELDRHIIDHDEDIRTLFDAIRELTEPPPKAQRRIGFRPKLEDH